MAVFTFNFDKRFFYGSSFPELEDDKLKDYQFIDEAIADGAAEIKKENWTRGRIRWETVTAKATKRIRFRGEIYQTGENMMFPLSRRLN